MQEIFTIRSPFTSIHFHAHPCKSMHMHAHHLIGSRRWLQWLQRPGRWGGAQHKRLMSETWWTNLFWTWLNLIQKFRSQIIRLFWMLLKRHGCWNLLFSLFVTHWCIWHTTPSNTLCRFALISSKSSCSCNRCRGVVLPGWYVCMYLCNVM